MSEEGSHVIGLFKELERLGGFGTPGQRLGLSFQQGCGWSCHGAVINYESLVEVGETKVRTACSRITPR